jgi:hypothetical protein
MRVDPDGWHTRENLLDLFPGHAMLGALRSVAPIPVETGDFHDLELHTCVDICNTSWLNLPRVAESAAAAPLHRTSQPMEIPRRKSVIGNPLGHLRQRLGAHPRSAPATSMTSRPGILCTFTGTPVANPARASKAPWRRNRGAGAGRSPSSSPSPCPRTHHAPAFRSLATGQGVCCAIEVGCLTRRAHRIRHRRPPSPV